MDFSLNETQSARKEKARKFANEQIRPISLERDAILDPFEAFDWQIIKKGLRLGFRTAVVSPKEGGHGINFVTQAIVMAEPAKTDSAISKTFSQCWKWSHLIAAVCNDDQQERDLKPFLEDDTFVFGFGATEPNGGPDNRLPVQGDIRAGLRLRVEFDGDDIVLNGSKLYIANGSIPKLLFLYVRTDPTVPINDGTSLVMAPRDAPGFRHGKVFNKSGWHLYQNTELIFEDARIPRANLVVEVNSAMKSGQGEVDGDIFGGLELSANGLSISDDAFEKEVNIVKTREQAGAPLKDQQLAQLKIGRMKMLTEALLSYVMRVAWEHDNAIHSHNAGALP